jgi:hypothetical protein
MKLLPLERTWTGDGHGAYDPVIHKQVKRTETVAMYSCQKQSATKISGYEVFLVKKRLKGQALPGGLFEQEDREVYPAAGSFGKIAWACSTLERAEQLFVELTTGKVATVEDAPESEETETVEVVEPARVSTRGKKEDHKAAMVFPAGEFTMKDIEALNTIPFSSLYFIVKEFIKEGTVQEVRKEPRGKGKPTVIYKKV